MLWVASWVWMFVYKNNHKIKDEVEVFKFGTVFFLWRKQVGFFKRKAGKSSFS